MRYVKYPCDSVLFMMLKYILKGNAMKHELSVAQPTTRDGEQLFALSDVMNYGELRFYYAIYVQFTFCCCCCCRVVVAIVHTKSVRCYSR